jgi:hypothetical protein
VKSASRSMRSLSKRPAVVGLHTSPTLADVSVMATSIAISLRFKLFAVHVIY